MVKTVKTPDAGSQMGYKTTPVGKQDRISGSTQRKFRRALRGETGGQRNYKHFVPPTALTIVSTLPTVQKPTVREVFGQLGRPELSRKPAQRLSPAMGRRLRRRGSSVVRQAVLVLQAEEARKAKAARDRETNAVKRGQCNARTKLGLRCKLTAVADGYCSKHGA